MPEEYALIPPDEEPLLLDGKAVISVSGKSVVIYEDPPFEIIGYSNVIDDGSGGVIVASRVGEESFSHAFSVYVQRIDADGNRLWGDSGLEIQWIDSSLTSQIITAGVILITVLALLSARRRNLLVRVLVAVTPVIIGIAALFSSVLLVSLYGCNYHWAYVLDTSLNRAAVAIVPIAGLIVGAVTVRRRTVTRWLTVPVLVFSFLVTSIVTIALYISIF